MPFPVAKQKFKAIVLLFAFKSSQLPEQKEGLFIVSWGLILFLSFFLFEFSDRSAPPGARNSLQLLGGLLQIKTSSLNVAKMKRKKTEHTFCPVFFICGYRQLKSLFFN